jgi:hypothetical protein
LPGKTKANKEEREREKEICVMLLIRASELKKRERCG